jgi:hypothetical protein
MILGDTVQGRRSNKFDITDCLENIASFAIGGVLATGSGVVPAAIFGATCYIVDLVAKEFFSNMFKETQDLGKASKDLAKIVVQCVVGSIAVSALTGVILKIGEVAAIIGGAYVASKGVSFLLAGVKQLQNLH